MIDEILRKIKSTTECTSIRIGNYNSVGKHLIAVYEVKNYGQLCTIRTKSDEAFIYTPFFTDMSMVVATMSGKELIVRVVDTHTTEKFINYHPLVDVVNKFSLGDIKQKACWCDDLLLPESVFKKGKVEDLNQLMSQWIGTYMQIQRDAPKAEELSKRRMAGIYCDGEFTEGGIISEIFKKDFKDDSEKMEFFSQVLFGIEEFSL